ncbi:hypothetical protein ABIB82_003878 [Bradyrhizobium sp. i1.8.4]
MIELSFRITGYVVVMAALPGAGLSQSFCSREGAGSGRSGHGARVVIRPAS